MTMRQVQPHTPGPGYLCGDCNKSHVAGCKDGRVDDGACPNVGPSAIATEFAGIFESVARVMRSGEELTPRIREDIASYLDRAASAAKILALTVRAVR